MARSKLSVVPAIVLAVLSAPLLGAVPAPAPLPAHAADVAGAEEARNLIEQLDADIARRHDAATDAQLETALELRNAAVERLVAGILAARAAPTAEFRLPTAERDAIREAVEDAGRFAHGGQTLVQAYILAPEGLEVWQRPWRIGGGWQPHTPGRFIRTRAYDIELRRAGSPAECRLERVGVYDQPTVHRLRCP